MIVVAVVALAAMGWQAVSSTIDDGPTVIASATTLATTTSVSLSTTPQATPNTVKLPGLAGGPGSPTSAPAPAATTTVAPTTTTAPRGLGTPLDPAWPKQLYVLSDSVVLSGKAALPDRFAGWQVTVDGRPALMVKKAVQELKQKGRPVGSVVVVALGYNSLWERNRRNYDRWARAFDQQAEDMLTTLKGLGAKKVVWVTLRELNPSIVPAKSVDELPLYSWYFPWVNERLRALVERHPEVALADWSAASQSNGLTYDSIHLNKNGAALMSDVIARAVGA
jgi:hypothetical protein